MNKKPLALAFSLLSLSLSSSLTPAALAQDPVPALSGGSAYQLDSTWTRQDGVRVKLATLAGHPVVLAMVYTSCQSACPIIISDLQRIESGLPPSVREQTRFALFAFDSTRDTPARLAEFAQEHGLDPARWSLYHGDAKAVRKLAAVLGVRYQKDRNGGYDHSNLITVLDRSGGIRHQQAGLRQDPQATISRIKELAQP